MCIYIYIHIIYIYIQWEDSTPPRHDRGIAWRHAHGGSHSHGRRDDAPLLRRRQVAASETGRFSATEHGDFPWEMDEKLGTSHDFCGKMWT